MYGRIIIKNFLLEFGADVSHLKHFQGCEIIFFACDVARLLVNAVLSYVHVIWSIVKHERGSKLRGREVWLPVKFRLLHENFGFCTKSLLQLKEHSPIVNRQIERYTLVYPRTI